MMGFPLESYSKSFTGAYRSGTLACIVLGFDFFCRVLSTILISNLCVTEQYTIVIVEVDMKPRNMDGETFKRSMDRTEESAQLQDQNTRSEYKIRRQTTKSTTIVLSCRSDEKIGVDRAFPRRTRRRKTVYSCI